MWFFSLILNFAFADIDRLTSGHSDLSQVEKIYLSPGLVSLIEFPQNIIEVRVGNPKSLKALISQVSPKELTIYLTNGTSVASNLIVRAEKRIFVFDIVPSKSNHQDYVKIKGSFGAPQFRKSSFSSSKKEMSLHTLKQRLSVEGLNSKTVKVGP